MKTIHERRWLAGLSVASLVLATLAADQGWTQQQGEERPPTQTEQDERDDERDDEQNFLERLRERAERQIERRRDRRGRERDRDRDEVRSYRGEDQPEFDRQDFDGREPNGRAFDGEADERAFDGQQFNGREPDGDQAVRGRGVLRERDRMRDRDRFRDREGFRDRDDERFWDRRERLRDEDARPQFLPPDRRDGRRWRDRWQLGVYTDDTSTGVRVERVMTGSPAERSGLERGDVIVTVDGYQVGLVGGQRYDLGSELQARAGRSGRVQLLVHNWRDGRLVNVDVRLERVSR